MIGGYVIETALVRQDDEDGPHEVLRLWVMNDMGDEVAVCVDADAGVEPRDYAWWRGAHVYVTRVATCLLDVPLRMRGFPHDPCGERLLRLV